MSECVWDCQQLLFHQSDINCSLFAINWKLRDKDKLLGIVMIQRILSMNTNIFACTKSTKKKHNWSGYFSDGNTVPFSLFNHFIVSVNLYSEWKWIWVHAIKIRQTLSSVHSNFLPSPVKIKIRDKRCRLLKSFKIPFESYVMNWSHHQNVVRVWSWQIQTFKFPIFPVIRSQSKLKNYLTRFMMKWLCDAFFPPSLHSSDDSYTIERIKCWSKKMNKYADTHTHV